MGLFSKDAPRVEPSDLDELREQIRDIEGRVKGLETEWVTVYQKMHRALGHFTKTRALASVGNGEPAEPAPQQQRLRTVEDLSRDEIARL